MTRAEGEEQQAFRDAVRGLLRGDFSRLAPLFEERPPLASSCPIIAWVQKGWFDNEPAALREALTCACFPARTSVVADLLARGVDPLAGANTGLNGFHWAANHGQLSTVRLLIEKRYRWR